MLNTAPVLTADFNNPLRAAAAYQYIPADAGDAAGIVADALFDVIYTLNSAYRAGAAWVMNSMTTSAVRKLKTAEGVYHWQPGLQVGQPDSLLGYPVETWEQMPDIATNAFPIGFGNWRKAYVLVERVGLRVTRDNITAPGFVKFFIRRREGGIVLNNDAAKFIRTII
jgi:HK97 family phage major capsid protein